MGYTKLFSEIIMSTVWREKDHVRLLWITMLALKDRWHIVNASLPGLADSARITMEECVDALKVLSDPDEHSRTKDYDGRRIEECDEGWVILNGEKYRNKMSLDERREYQRIKQKEYRARKKLDENVKSCQQYSQQFTHTEEEEKTKEKEKEKERKNSTPKTSFPDFKAKDEIWIEFGKVNKIEGRIGESMFDFKHRVNKIVRKNLQEQK